MNAKTSGGTDAADSTGLIDPPTLREALQLLYEETASYIRINHLGDVHHNYSMQMARDALLASAVAVPPLPAVELEKVVGDALQEVWEDHVGDTGDFPPCLTMHLDNTISANFRGSAFATNLAARLARAALSAPAGETRAPEVVREALRACLDSISYPDEKAADEGKWALPLDTVTKIHRALALLDQAPGAQARAHEDDALRRWTYGVDHGFPQFHQQIYPELIGLGWRCQSQEPPIGEAFDPANYPYYPSAEAAIDAAMQAHTEKPAP